MSTKKDFYSILGVARDASQDVILEAYHSRARVIHPDRFDAKRQPNDWKKANEMLSELNEAFETLSDVESRRRYDAGTKSSDEPAAGDRKKTNRPKDRSKPSERIVPLQTGTAGYQALPRDLQAELLRRQTSTLADQFKLKTSSTLSNYIYAVLLLAWFAFLVHQAQGQHWGEAVYFYGGVSMVAGPLLAGNLLSLARAFRTTLHSYFYITRLYFVNTEHDIVTFHPICKLSNVSVTHNYRNGTYQSTLLALEFGTNTVSLTVPSREKTQEFLSKLKAFDSRAREEIDRGNHHYFEQNDLFCRVDVSRPPADTNFRKGTRGVSYFAGTIAALIVFAFAYNHNDQHAIKKWLQQAESRPAVASSVVPDRFTSPQYRPRVSASKPMFVPPAALPVPELPLPANGKTNVFDFRNEVAPFEIRTSAGSNYLVKLVDVSTGRESRNVFVRGGMVVEINVPLGTYEVRYASGEKWYGDRHHFGPQTSYSKADKYFDFRDEGNHVSGYSITLYQVPNGNLHTKSISPEDF